MKILSLQEGLHFCHMTVNVSKMIYANMVVKSYVKTSTFQLAAPKLSNVNFDILNLKNKKWSNFLCILWNFLCILMYFEGGQDNIHPYSN